MGWPKKVTKCDIRDGGSRQRVMLHLSKNLLSTIQLMLTLNSYSYHSKPISSNHSSKKYYLDRSCKNLGTYGMAQSLEFLAQIVVSVCYFLGV